MTTQTETIQQKLSNFIPKVGIILGSGLGRLAERISNPIIIPYNEIPGFKICTVTGHEGQLIAGTIGSTPVICLQGRAHYYEGIENQVIIDQIALIKELGCHTLVLTNAAGSLRNEMPTGSIMLITDHINFQGRSPLVGLNSPNGNPYFISMEDAYDLNLRTKAQQLAKKLEITLHEGVYIGVLGPQFETPAEIRVFATLGADAVGMSTVPEVIAARLFDLKVCAFSAITNMAAGLSREKKSHELTLSGAKLVEDQLSKLV
ncbi:MAG: purine-nucleoside phosphorylase, partial [Gammaproteobacteria bacterium]